MAVYILDRLTKLLVMDRMELNQSVTVVAGFFDIVHVRNTGAAFSFLASWDSAYRTPFFLAATVAAMALLLHFVRKTRPEDTLMLVAMALIMGGAAGNLTDRLVYGNVVDFIEWYVGRYRWPAFNIADSGITVGIVLMGIEVFFRGRLADES
jgi:signal peptidase II